jgi:hypothetical protein
MFRKNIASIFRVENQDTQVTSMKQVARRASLLGLFFDPENGGDMYLQNDH